MPISNTIKTSLNNPLSTVFCQNISKAYGKVQALKEVNIDIHAGELYGLIGPDGAGKTTLFRILTTLILADSGSASVGGFDVVKDYKKIRSSVGYMPGRFSLYQDLTVEENLNFFAHVFGTTIEENYDLIKEIYQQIEPFRTRRAGALSGGMKQKLALSCALIHKPTILFLDEPTTGVDPVSRKEFWGILNQLKQQGITILVSTPYMDEASLCDRIALINNGEILKVDAPQNMVAHFDKIIWGIRSNNMHQLLIDVRSHPDIDSCFSFGDSLHATLRTKKLTPDEMEKWLRGKGHAEVEVIPIEGTVEDCFMDLNKQ